MTKQGLSVVPIGRRRRPLLLFLGTRIRQLREEHGWSQRAFAARINVSASLLAKYEGGETEPPLRTLLRIAHALEVPLGLLADERHSSEPIGDAGILARIRDLTAFGEAEKGAVVAVLDIFLSLRRLEAASRRGEAHGAS